jgi:lysine-arginine-ornithine-binding protein
MSKLLKLTLILALVLTAAVAVMPSSAQDTATIVVGTNAEYPPFESVDEAGEIVGFDIDLFNAIAADAGFEVEYVNTKWDGIFVALAEGEFDAVISAATITEEREEIIDFSDPYFNAGQAIAVSADLAETVAGPEDLAGLRVGVQLGTTGDTYATDEVDGAEVVRFDEVTLAMQALGAGEVDAVISDGPTVADILANNPDINGVIVGEPLTDEFYGIAVNPERSDLLDAINTSLANIIADGTYADIYESWFGTKPSSDFMPMDEMAADAGGAMEVDFTDPASVVLGLMDTFFGATEAEELLVFACEGATDSPLFPDNETLAGFAGMDLSDASGVNLEVEYSEDDTVASVTASADSTIVLMIGEAEQELPVSLLLAQLGIESIRLTKDADGMWFVCPEAE